MLDACAEAGVAVPGRVLVLGTDDEEFVCRQTNPTLSSIVPDFAAAGLCGFKSDGYLKQLFRSRHGCTMREWRRRARGR